MHVRWRVGRSKCRTSAGVAMHVTMYRVRSQDVCLTPNTMPKSYIGNYAHQQATLRSLPEGKGSMLIELWERQVASFPASKQQPKCPLHWFECASLASLQRPPDHLLHMLVTFWSILLNLMLKTALTMQAMLFHDQCVRTHVCPQENWMHTNERKGVPSTLSPWWQQSALRLLCAQGQCSKGHWQIPYIHSKPYASTCIATCNLICIAFMAYQQCCWGPCMIIWDSNVK